MISDPAQVTDKFDISLRFKNRDHANIFLALGSLSGLQCENKLKIINTLYQAVKKKCRPVSYTHLDVYKRQVLQLR